MYLSRLVLLPPDHSNHRARQPSESGPPNLATPHHLIPVYRFRGLQRRCCPRSVPLPLPPSIDYSFPPTNPSSPPSSGDKSNHVATIHLAQMLYIWPLVAFFSIPLLIPPLLRLLRNPSSGIYSLVLSPRPIYTIPYTILTAVLSLAVVKFNTIIHPFTLADNRHYMFYIFRYTVLRSLILRLALVIPYTACRWLVWASLAPPPSVSEQGEAKLKTRTPEFTKKKDGGRQGGEEEEEGEEVFALLDSPSSVSSLPPQTSTVLLLFITTALSLVTAPLVEPRYFILPWAFYRLLVPAAPLTTTIAKSSWLGKLDGRLFVETVWFAGINLVTMYIFLFKPYVWVAEGGKLLDEGRLQRFMW